MMDVRYASEYDLYLFKFLMYNTSFYDAFDTLAFFVVFRLELY